MGASSRIVDSRRALSRGIIALAVALATVIAPVGGLPSADAALKDLPDQTWGVINRARSLTTSTPAEVMAIAQIGNTIYAGGQFTTVVRRRQADPQNAQAFLAAFDATTGDWIDWWTPEFNGPVFALEAAADGSRLYVGGEFTEVNGHPGTAGIVALDPATGLIDYTWTPRVESAFVDDPGVVRTIKESGGFLYIGGTFTHVTGNAASSRLRTWKVARLSLTDGSADPSWRPILTGGSVWGLDRDPVRGRVYLTGFFSAVNGADPSDRFAVVRDTDGSTITGLERFPELTPDQDHQFEVIANGDYVWVAGTQHVIQMLNADDLSINRRWFAGFENGFHIGGDFQAMGILDGDTLYATCHCWGVVREIPNWVTTLNEARNIQPIVDEIQGVLGFDLATGDYISGWDPDIYGQIGGWAVHGAPDGCLWAGGDFNRRSVGDQWHNGLIRWCDEAGQGDPAGPPLTQQPLPESNPPSTPGSFVADDAGDGTVTLNWSASSDDTAVVYYRVYRNGTMIRATQTLTLQDLSPTPGDVYTVRAVDPYGNESADSVSATPNLGGLAVPVLTASFDGNGEGFVYADDTFKGTSLPDFADGLLLREGGSPDGYVMVVLGGVDNSDTGPFSGAFSKNFTVAVAGDYELSFQYRLDVKDGMDNSEYGQALATIDGVYLGSGGRLAQIADGGDTGWVTYTVTRSLSAGTHTLALGAYQNYKTVSNEFIEVSFDSVSVIPVAPAVGFTSPTPGSDITGSAAFELRATSPVYSSSSLAVDVSANGGATWTPAAWNGASGRFDATVNVGGLPDGPITLTARVTDGASRTGTGSAGYVVNNDADPSISITNPTNGANVTGVVPVRVDASDPNDPVGSLDVKVSVNGGATWNSASWDGSRYVWDWDTAVNGDGAATVRARVTDSGGTTVNAAPVNVTVGSPVGYSNAVIDDGAVAYWRLGESSGTTAVDATGGDNGTYSGAPGLGTAALIADSNTSVTFDGVDDLVHVPNSAALNVGGPYEQKTVELWFRANDVASRRVLYEQGAPARGMNMYVDGGRLYAGAWNRTSNDGDPTTPWADNVFVSAPISAATVYHAVAVFDYPSNSFSLYVNGSLAASTTGVGRLYAHGGLIGLGAMNDSSRFHNGGSAGGDNFFFDGTIDEVAVYNTALTAGTIAAHHTIGGPEVGNDYQSTVVASGASVYWRLGEASGTTADDLLGANEATYLGSPGLGASGVITDSDSAVNFDGVNDIVEIPDGAAVNLGGPYESRTIELWFNADNVTDRQVIYEQGATSRGWNLYVMDGRLYGGAWNVTSNADPSTPWASPVFVSTPVATGTVYHVALVHDYASDTLALYVNGSLADSAGGLGLLYSHAGDSSIGGMNDSSRFHDGGKAGGNNYYFDGVIDEVALYPVVLSGATIANHHTVGLL